MLVGRLLEIVRAVAAPLGLNLIAATPSALYDAEAAPAMRASSIDPACRSIIVAANGGGGFWREFKRHAERNPGWMERENPLDDFTRTAVESRIAPVIREAGFRCIPAFPFMGGASLNFMLLGRLAGIAGPSIIGVLVHPSFGPWIAFRAALLVDAEVDEPGGAAGFNPCPSCATRSCIAACPAAAVSFPAGWDIPRCLIHRIERQEQCESRCHARVDCVIGREHRYPEDELAYHQERALRAMRPYYEARIRPHRT